MTLLLFYVAVALGFSFLCSVAEAVLLSITPSFLALKQDQQPLIGNLLQRLKQDVNKPLAAILTLNTIAHTLGAAGAGAQAAAVFGDAYVGVISAILTLLILIFSEIIPKTLGAVYWRQLAPITGFFLKYLVIVLYPFVWFSEKITRGIAGDQAPQGLSRDEFVAIADLGAREGQLHNRESRILKNLLRFHTTPVKDIMTPRPVMFALPQSLSIGQFFTEYGDKAFSRIPIYADNRDEISGFVLRSDLLLAHARNETARSLQEFRRELGAVPETALLLGVFDYILDRRAHIALVVDEYGSTMGLLTLEDILETLIGFEIIDENDRNVDMQALARHLWTRRAQQMGLTDMGLE
mgnify:CR=1 FL=1